LARTRANVGTNVGTTVFVVLFSFQMRAFKGRERPFSFSRSRISPTSITFPPTGEPESARPNSKRRPVDIPLRNDGRTRDRRDGSKLSDISGLKKSKKRELCEKREYLKNRYSVPRRFGASLERVGALFFASLPLGSSS
jgi:hypothetical protein